MNNNNFKKIQILGNTQVSGYFAYCRLVNYDNMTQAKTIKSLYQGGKVCLISNSTNITLNTIYHDDVKRKNNIGFVIGDNGHIDGTAVGSQYSFKLLSNEVYGIPYSVSESQIFSTNCIIFNSSNKSYSKYILCRSDMILFCDSPSIKRFAMLQELQATSYNVSYVDFCISTNVPLVMEYLGEIEVMQSDNNNKVNNSFFIINRYVKNPL